MAVGDITRTYISSSGVPFTPGDVCVFEGLTHVQSLARTWYAANLSEGIAGERAREAERERHQPKQERELGPEPIEEAPLSSLGVRPSATRATFSFSKKDGEEEDLPATLANAEKNLPAGFKIISSEPLVEKKSTFVGHAVRVTDEREVPLVIHELLSDRKIAKAAHPAIFAYRIAKEVGGPAGKVYNAGEFVQAVRILRRAEDRLRRRRRDASGCAVETSAGDPGARERAGRCFAVVWRHAPRAGPLQAHQPSGAGRVGAGRVLGRREGQGQGCERRCRQRERREEAVIFRVSYGPFTYCHAYHVDVASCRS